MSENNPPVSRPQGRKRLPDRRQVVRREFESDPQDERGVPCTVSIGFADDGRPAEVFLSTRKRGSMFDALMHDAGIAISLALQHGATVEEMEHSFGRTSDGKRTTVLGTAIDFAAAVAAENAKVETCAPR